MPARYFDHIRSVRARENTANNGGEARFAPRRCIEPTPSEVLTAVHASWVRVLPDLASRPGYFFIFVLAILIFASAFFANGPVGASLR